MSRSWRHQSLKRSRRCVLVGRPVLRSDNALLISLSQVHNERKVSVKKKKKNYRAKSWCLPIPWGVLPTICHACALLSDKMTGWASQRAAGGHPALLKLERSRDETLPKGERTTALVTPAGIIPTSTPTANSPFLSFSFLFFLKIVSVCVHETSFFPPFFSEGTIWSEYVKPLVHMKS